MATVAPLCQFVDKFHALRVMKVHFVAAAVHYLNFHVNDGGRNVSQDAQAGVLDGGGDDDDVRGGAIVPTLAHDA